MLTPSWQAYWLLFSIIWITIRLNELRTSGPRDDGKWSFGQILPLILLIAPVAIALENFYTNQKNIALEITGALHQNNTTNVPDHTRELQHLDTIAYRGALLLALLSYLEIGVYFILTQQASDGLITPMVQILILMLFFNPFLQFMWINFEMWISQASWKVTSKRACYDTVLQSFVAISFATNFAALISGYFLLYSREILFAMIFLPCIYFPVCFACGYLCFVLVFSLIAKVEFTKWAFIISLIFLGFLFLLPLFTVIPRYANASSIRFYLSMAICTVGFLLLLLTNYGLQVWVERKHFSNWLVLCLRCILITGVCTIVFFIPDGMAVFLLPGSLASSFLICIFIFTGSRLVSQLQQSE